MFRCSFGVDVGRKVLSVIIFRNFLLGNRVNRNNYCFYGRVSGLCETRKFGFDHSYSKITSPTANMPAFEGFRYSWDLQMSPEKLLSQTDDIISTCRKSYDAIGSVKKEDVSSENILKALGNIDCVFNSASFLYSFPQAVSTNKALREASVEAEKKLEKFAVEIEMRQDIFQNLLALEANQVELSYNAKRYLEKLIKKGKRNGLHLSEELQKEIKAIKSEINDLSIQFNKNVTESNVVLEFTDEELAGLPEDFISNLDKSDDSKKRKVTLKYPHYIPIMQKAKNPETRRKLEFAYNTQCLEENPKLLEQIAALRHKLATILGFSTYTDYATDILMSKSAKNVSKFLLDLVEKLTPLWDEEKKYMLELKEKECNDLNIPFNGKLDNWDLRYYTTRVEELKYSVDDAKLQEYFPLPVVTKGLLEIYQTLLGLKFEEIKDCSAWHPDVQLFNVKDAETGRLMGYFFLDLFPREGKYSHAANFEMQPGCIYYDTEQIPIVGVLTNFTKPTSEKPSLLKHNEVVTFFHEFGHTMHCICSEATFCSMRWFKVEMDFVEAPSQMLENWCWTSEGLKWMSSHYQNQKPLPKDMVDALVKSRLANTGYKNLRQCCLAMFDHKIHTRKEADVRAVYKEVSQDFMGLEPTEGTCFAATFQHLAHCYGAQYYGYLWSEVFSEDMFQTCFGEKNLLNPSVGKTYRNKILRPGASKDAADMLKDFLGREPNQDAFLRSKGLTL